MMIGRYFTTQTIYGRNFVCTFGFAITNQTKVPLPERFSPCFQKTRFFLNNFFGFGTSRWAMPASAMTLTPCRTINVFIPCLQMFASKQIKNILEHELLAATFANKTLFFTTTNKWSEHRPRTISEVGRDGRRMEK